MDRESTRDALIGKMNVWIMLVIALIYTVTGTSLGDDAIAALGRGAVYRGKSDDTVAIQCAVTWEAMALNDMLDTLDQARQSITFFVSGKWASAHASTLVRMAEAGHEIGVCGYDPTLDGDETLVYNDVRAAKNTVERITGKRVLLYYAGLRDADISARAAARTGMTCVSCTHDLLSARAEAHEMTSRVSKTAYGGTIYHIQPTREAADALDSIIDTLHTSGFAIKRTGDLLRGRSTAESG